MMQSNAKTFFDRLVWRDDRMLLDDLVFRLEHTRSSAWELGDDCFIFYKIKPLVDQYAQFWARLPEFRAERVLELGLWDGGSIAFWCELLRPRKHVGLDYAQRADSRYFRRYVESRGLADTIATYWGVDQRDAARLRAIVRDELGGTLDLVIDDASHRYAATKISFETLFPLLRPGGLYVVEDWAWAHWRGFLPPGHDWRFEPPLTRLVDELRAAAGSGLDLLASLTIYQGFAVAERGPAVLPADSAFRLADHSYTAPRPTPAQRALWHARRLARALRRRFVRAER